MRVVILIGPPGSGKGTQATLIAEKYNLYYFETSKIIEQKVTTAKEEDFVEIDGKKYSLAHEFELWKSGFLCTPKVVSLWVREKFNELAREGRGLVIAGSPRTLDEGKEVMPVLEDLYGKEKIEIVRISLSSEESIWRNSHRRLCELMRHPILYSEDTKALTVCPLDGSKLVKREGLDDPETIRVRLKEYEERTKPLIGFFGENGFKVREVNGEQTVAEVFSAILSVL